MARPLWMQLLEAPESTILRCFVHVPPPEKEIRQVVNRVAEVGHLRIGRATSCEQDSLKQMHVLRERDLVRQLVLHRVIS